ncbi:VOC family protein [Leptothrix ochracea]|uniref:VOC family protein n=1 Tax=Leptothrix ochracea TaxID=735331 RepID=UPI0034E19F1A
MSTAASCFVWYELMAEDAEAAAAFYTRVFGWQASSAGPGTDYTLLSVGRAPVAGLMTLPPEACAAGAVPSWVGYVAVDDVDAKAAEIAADGGMLRFPGTDMPGVGRFAVITDPAGAPLVLFKPDMNAMRPPPLPPGTPGTVSWHELHGAEAADALAWHGRHFGWQGQGAMDMGARGAYQFFSTGEGPALGAMLRRLPEMPRPMWLYYINVESVAAAIERVGAAGGKIIMGPHPVPGGNLIAHGLDPQGVLFAMVGPGV